MVFNPSRLIGLPRIHVFHFNGLIRSHFSSHAHTPHMISIEFLITSLVVVLIPGTGVIFTIATGLSHGRTASVWAAIGCTLGIVPHLLATIMGLAALMHSSAVAFQTLKYAGSAYLLYLTYSTWKNRASFQVEGVRPAGSGMKLIGKAVLLNLLNPKLTVFFLAFLPQFIRPDAAQPIVQLILLSSVFMLMTFVIFVFYGCIAHTFRQFVIGSTRIQNALRHAFASAFAALALRLALTEH